MSCENAMPSTSSDITTVPPSIVNVFLQPAIRIVGQFKLGSAMRCWRALFAPNRYANEVERQVAEDLLARLGKLD
jgi:hypothetical protein